MLKMNVIGCFGMTNHEDWHETEIPLVDIFISSLGQVSSLPSDLQSIKRRIYSYGRSFKLADLELESLAVLELCIYLEFNYSIVLSPEDYLMLVSVDDLLRKIGNAT